MNEKIAFWNVQTMQDLEDSVHPHTKSLSLPLHQNSGI